MARGRFVSKTISLDEKVNDLSDDTARLLFTWLITHLDCEGRMYGDSQTVKSTVFPRRPMSTVKMEKYLQELEKVGLIFRYSVNGFQYLCMKTFEKHQPGLRKNREAPSQIPAFTPDQLLTNDGISPAQVKVKDQVKVPPKGGTTQGAVSPEKQIKKTSEKKTNSIVNEIFSEMRGFLGYPNKVCGGEAVPAIEESSARDARSKREKGAIIRGEGHSSAAEVSAGEAKKAVDPIPNYGKEGKAIKRMLTRGFTREEILDCWKQKVSQRGGEFVSMTWVNEDIGKPTIQKGIRRLSTDEEIAASIEEATTWHGDS